MSYLGPRPESSSSSEVALLTALNNLGISGANESIQKTGVDSFANVAAAGTGTVTSVSVTTANGISGSVATATSTPAITLSLGAITPTSVVASGTLSGSNLSGTNTGDNAANSSSTYIGTTAVALNRTSAALTLAGITLTTPDIGTPSAGTLTNVSGLPISGLVASTSTAIGVGSIELGHANDTTITRSGAGAIQVEGVQVILSGAALGTPASGTLTNCTGLPASGLASGTIGASINLGEGADPATIGIVIDSAMSADERYSGITVPGTAGATLAFGDLCYLDVTATEWLLADADAASTSGDVVLGICVDASTDGNATSMLLLGTVRSAAFPASIALGAPVYVDVTAGDITATAPTGTDDVMRRVGFAVTAEPNTIYFNPSNDYVTHT